MIAAVRILIWLPVRLVRRSRISNMAFPNGACSLSSGAVAPCSTAMGEGYPPAVASGKPRDSRTTHAEIERSYAPGRTAHKQDTGDCGSGSAHGNGREGAARRVPRGNGAVERSL